MKQAARLEPASMAKKIMSPLLRIEIDNQFVLILAM